MRHHRRRAFFLTQFLGMLPVIVAILTIGTELVVHIIRFEGRVSRQMADEAKMSDLARRIERDAGRAETAAVEVFDHKATLRFPTVQYTADGRRITRTETASDGTVASYSWTLEKSAVGFTVENIARPATTGASAAVNQRSLVWVIFRSPLLTEQGPVVERTRSCAARIHAGRAS